jgi:hypothetical protein
MTKNTFSVVRGVKESFRENPKSIQDVRFDICLRYGSVQKDAQIQQEL